MGGQEPHPRWWCPRVSTYATATLPLMPRLSSSRSGPPHPRWAKIRQGPATSSVTPTKTKVGSPPPLPALVTTTSTAYPTHSYSSSYTFFPQITRIVLGGIVNPIQVLAQILSLPTPPPSSRGICTLFPLVIVLLLLFAAATGSLTAVFHLSKADGAHLSGTSPSVKPIK